MDKTAQLIPNSYPPIMRHALGSLRFDDTLSPALESVKAMRWPEPPEQFLPWLVHEMGLQEFIGIKPDLAELFEEGRELVRVKGTVRAVKIVLAWMGYEDITVDTLGEQGVHFPEFGIGLDHIPDDPQDLCVMIQVVNTIKPLRSRFRRVHNGHDIPIFRLSHSPWGHCVSDYSGIHSTELPLCTSPLICNHDLRISFRIYDTDQAIPYDDPASNLLSDGNGDTLVTGEDDSLEFVD